MAKTVVECENGITYTLEDDENGGYTVYGDDGLIIIYGEYSWAGPITAIIECHDTVIAQLIVSLFEHIDESVR